MRFALLCATALCAAPASAVNIVHSGDNPWAYTYTDNGDGKDYAHFEADLNYFVDGLNTVRFDVQGGTIAGGMLNFGWWNDVWVKTGNKQTIQFLHEYDTCKFGSYGSGCAAPAFVTDFQAASTFVQFSFDQPKSYLNCAIATTSGVCGEQWWFADFFHVELAGSGPKSFTVTYSGDKVVTPTPGVPEPASWAMMIVGFGLVGTMARRRPTGSALA